MVDDVGVADAGLLVLGGFVVEDGAQAQWRHGEALSLVLHDLVEQDAYKVAG